MACEHRKHVRFIHTLLKVRFFRGEKGNCAERSEVKQGKSKWVLLGSYSAGDEADRGHQDPVGTGRPVHSLDVKSEGIGLSVHSCLQSPRTETKR